MLIIHNKKREQGSGEDNKSKKVEKKRGKVQLEGRSVWSHVWDANSRTEETRITV